MVDWSGRSESTLSSCDVPVKGDGSSAFPSFEDLRHWYGLLLYKSQGTRFPATSIAFNARNVHDRVQVFVDGTEVGNAYRAHGDQTVATPSGSSMGLLVENMGRVNYGSGIFDYKGLFMPPPVNGSWTAVCLPLAPAQVQALPFAATTAAATATTGPVFRRGTLHIAGTPTDTFLDSRGFSKGYIWVNGQNLGRYWETAGPQHTLYVPGPFLHTGDNEVIVFDLHGSNATSILSVAHPRWA